MDKNTLELTARLVALELLVENAYAVALMQTRNPAGEARSLGALCSDLARRLEAGGKEGDSASALAAGIGRALDSIIGRIRARLEKRAEDYPTAGRAETPRGPATPSQRNMVTGPGSRSPGRPAKLPITAGFVLAPHLC